jgi:hypothetical protein
VLHHLRFSLNKINSEELHVPAITLKKVLDMYSLHIKYLRSHTLTALLSQTKISDHYVSIIIKKTLYLDLENGLTDKELTITLDKCLSLESNVVCKLMYEAGESLDLILSCLNKLSQAFSHVES